MSSAEEKLCGSAPARAEQANAGSRQIAAHERELGAVFRAHLRGLDEVDAHLPAALTLFGGVFVFLDERLDDFGDGALLFLLLVQPGADGRDVVVAPLPVVQVVLHRLLGDERVALERAAGEHGRRAGEHRLERALVVEVDLEGRGVRDLLDRSPGRLEAHVGDADLVVAAVTEHVRDHPADLAGAEDRDGAHGTCLQRFGGRRRGF